MEPRHHAVDGTAPLAPGVTTDMAVSAAAGLEAIARDRLSMASNDLAGIATDALPAVQLRLLEVIADLDALANELRHIIIVLRNGHNG